MVCFRAKMPVKLDLTDPDVAQQNRILYVERVNDVGQSEEHGKMRI